MSDEIDEDEFLYGSANEDGHDAKRQRLETAPEETQPEVTQLADSIPATNSENNADDDPYDDDDGDDDDDDESGSEVEFILGPSTSSSSRQADTAPGSSGTASEAAQDQPAEAPEESEEPELVNEKDGDFVAKKIEKPNVSAIDIDAVAVYNGRPITEINPNEFEDKPWRRPGADISDYFNYGFDEFTWMAYTRKQDQLRTSYTPQKVMGMMGMPPMFMPGMPMPGMPGMGGMPGMPGMNQAAPRSPQIHQLGSRSPQVPQPMPQPPPGSQDPRRRR